MLLFPLHIKQQNGLLHYTPLRKAQMIYFKCLLKLPIFQSLFYYQMGKKMFQESREKCGLKKLPAKM